MRDGASESNAEGARSAVRFIAATVAILAAVLLEASIGREIDATWLTVGLVLFVAALVAARAPGLFWVSRVQEPEPARQPASGTSRR